MIPTILALTKNGVPDRWINIKEAAHYYASGQVAWARGTTEFVLRGGTCVATGNCSEIRANSIIAIEGEDFKVRNFQRVPTVTKEMLLKRDRHTCAYCAETFKENMVDVEHIVPDSRGGEYAWMNLVIACKACNDRKSNRTPEEAGMKLHYVPYIPNLFEELILSGRKVLADQMEFLLSGVPKHSRLLLQ